MKYTIELRLINIAEKIAEMYQHRVSNEYYQQLCNAINVCKEYHIKGQGDWGDMYDAILYDDGIWEYAYYKDFDEEIQDMWAVETDILMCNCYLGCVAEHDSTPQNMEIQGDNIPEFVSFLENIIQEKLDFKKIFSFWEEKMCY